MTTTYLKFSTDSPEMQVFTTWWRALDANRGDRAELRRCSTLTEVVFTPAYHRLRFAIMKYGIVNDNALALVAGLAARVKSDTGENTLAEQMATPKDPTSKEGRAKVSGLRFRRLLKIKEPDGLFNAMGRIVALLGGAVNLQSLVNGVYFWNDRTRKQWAFEYYSKLPSEQ